MSLTQKGILASETKHARFLTFSIGSDPELPETLDDLQENFDPETTVIGVGLPLVLALRREINGLRLFPALAGPAIEIPSTPSALWCWLRGTDRGELFHRSRELEDLLSPSFLLDDVVECFQHDAHRDLTGYEDGTENPQGEALQTAALVHGKGPGLDGSSFVAAQQWAHDFDAFQGLSPQQQDLAIGRRRSDNQELSDAPASAHVQRTTQESFQPPAFVLRRSMPWTNNMAAGLYFVAFGHSFDAFEAQLHRMIGKDDGITDALFQFTRPVSGAYFWCPPVKNGKLDLALLAL